MTRRPPLNEDEPKKMQTSRENPDGFKHEVILSGVTTTIEKLIQDWDLAQPIGVGTHLVADLGFESIDLIQLAAALGQEFGRSNIGFAELLIRDSRYVDDLTVGQIADFLASRL